MEALILILSLLVILVTSLILLSAIYVLISEGVDLLRILFLDLRDCFTTLISTLRGSR